MAGLGATALVACGGAGDEVATPPDEPAVSAPTRYDCFGLSATADELEAAPSIVDLDDHPGVDAFAAATDELEGWMAVQVEDDRLGAIRALDPPDVLDGEVRDHERLVVERIGEAAGGEEVDDDGWMPTSAGPCALRAELDGLGPAAVMLDPDAPPRAEDRTLSLLVVETACASGQPATGRVAVSVDASADEIRLVVGVEPLAGDQSCPSNPATPITIDFDEPIGDRRLVDAARFPPIELEEAPPELRTDR